MKKLHKLYCILMIQNYVLCYENGPLNITISCPNTPRIEQNFTTCHKTKDGRRNEAKIHTRTTITSDALTPSTQINTNMQSTINATESQSSHSSEPTIECIPNYTAPCATIKQDTQPRTPQHETQNSTHICPEINITQHHAPRVIQQGSVTTYEEQGIQWDPVLPIEHTPPGSKIDNPTLHAAPFSLLAFLIKPTVILGTVSIGYSAILTKLLYTSYITLSRTDTWSYWHEVSAQSGNKPENTLALELFTTMQEKYAYAQNGAGFLSPLVHFINDVDKESKELEHFIKLHVWLDYLRATPLFPKQIQSLEIAAKKIERLEYLKKLMLKSVGEYKVGA